MQEEGYVSTGSEQLHYRTYGTGALLLLAFHGYGEDARTFRVIAPFLKDVYTIISVDLPHHGGSPWSESLPLTKAALKTMIENLLTQAGRSALSLVGYSIGGRVCLTLVELMPERIHKIVLIAPDGLQPSRLYYFVTRTKMGQRLFKNFLRGDKHYYRLIDGLYHLKLIDPARYKFVMRYLVSDEQRQLLQQVWPALRLLLPEIALVRDRLVKHHIPMHIFMGRYDRVIPLRHARRFMKHMPAHIKLHVLERGHVMFDADSVQKIAQSLL